MSGFEQVPYRPATAPPADIFAGNADPRCPVVLLLDKSASMGGRPIEQLNEGVRIFKEEVSKDALASRRAEIAVVSFGPVTRDTDFATIDRFHPPILRPEGDTPLGRAVCVALDMITDRKRAYVENGIQYYRPWIFLITDGAPTDDWNEAARRIRKEEDDGRVAFFAVACEGADFATLAKISVRPPLRLKGLQFRELFLWLSGTLKAVSRTQPGTKVALPPPGWSEV